VDNLAGLLGLTGLLDVAGPLVMRLHFLAGVLYSSCDFRSTVVDLLAKSGMAGIMRLFDSN
jgi:hypothetical protein